MLPVNGVSEVEGLAVDGYREKDPDEWLQGSSMFFQQSVTYVRRCARGS